MPPSDWSFNLRSYDDSSDDSDHDISHRTYEDSLLWKELDTSTRRDTVDYKPNPFSIAKINASLRGPRNDKRKERCDGPSELPYKTPTMQCTDRKKAHGALNVNDRLTMHAPPPKAIQAGPLVEGFKKQAQRKPPSKLPENLNERSFISSTPQSAKPIAVTSKKGYSFKALCSTMAASHPRIDTPRNIKAPENDLSSDPISPSTPKYPNISHTSTLLTNSRRHEHLINVPEQLPRSQRDEAELNSSQPSQLLSYHGDANIDTFMNDMWSSPLITDPAAVFTAFKREPRRAHLLPPSFSSPLRRITREQSPAIAQSSPPSFTSDRQHHRSTFFPGALSRPFSRKPPSDMDTQLHSHRFPSFQTFSQIQASSSDTDSKPIRFTGLRRYPYNFTPTQVDCGLIPHTQAMASNRHDNADIPHQFSSNKPSLNHPLHLDFGESLSQGPSWQESFASQPNSPTPTWLASALNASSPSSDKNPRHFNSCSSRSCKRERSPSPPLSIFRSLYDDSNSQCIGKHERSPSPPIFSVKTSRRGKLSRPALRRQVSPVRPPSSTRDAYDFLEDTDVSWSTLPQKKTKTRSKDLSPFRRSRKFIIPGIEPMGGSHKIGMSADSKTRVITFLPPPPRKSQAVSLTSKQSAWNNVMEHLVDENHTVEQNMADITSKDLQYPI